MAAAESNGEPQAAASAPGEGEVADNTALASGGSAPLSPPTESGPARRTWRAAGTPVSGLFQRGSPSPPHKRTKKTGEAGEADEDESVWRAQQEAEAHREAQQFEADNEEDELKWRQIQEEREQDAEGQRLADLHEAAQDQASHFDMDGQEAPKRKEGMLTPSTKKLSKAKASALPVDKKNVQPS